MSQLKTAKMHLNNLTIMNKAYEYALEYIDKYMESRKIDPLVITSIILQMIRTDNEDLESIDDTAPREIISQKYEKLLKSVIVDRDIADCDMLFDTLVSEHPELSEIPEEIQKRLYNDAFTDLSHSESEIYETSRYNEISDKIYPIVKDYSFHYINKD